MVLVAFPAALIQGIMGIIYDERKTLAIISTAISGAMVLLYFYTIAATIFCR